MSVFKPLLPWHQHSWQQLNNYSVQQRIPQALLITGQKGLGKLQLAHQFGFALLCEQPQSNGLCCQQCHSCLLLNADTHPDFIQIMPDEPAKIIGIDQIRQLITRLTLKPQFERSRVVIVNPAEMMNNRAINAFLKCLEEPTERSVIILVTDKPAYLPATIASRCQKLHVTTPDKATSLSWLKQHTQDQPELVLNLAQGAPLLALNYADKGDIDIRNNCFNDWLALAQHRNHPVIVAENWQKLSETSLIFWMTSWVIDVIKCYYHAQADNLYNPDLSESLQFLANKLPLTALYALYDLLLITQQRLDTQINKQLMFEDILIQWVNINRSQ